MNQMEMMRGKLCSCGKVHDHSIRLDIPCAVVLMFQYRYKVYVKGRNTGTFISSLDVGKIMKTCCSALKVLCDIVGVDCKKVCNKQ